MKYTLTIPDGYVKPYLPGLTKWVEALRSGEYKQGTGFLCCEGRYCCLGVLCKINNRPLLLTEISKEEAAELGVIFDKSNNKLSPAFESAYRVLQDLGSFPHNVYAWIRNQASFSLADCNDKGLTFLEIADIIEQVWQEPPPVV
jgi:hypothetical protein